MKLLNGADLVGYIKERQARAVRSIWQAHRIVPKLVIIRTNPDPVVDSYMRLKAGYGEDIGVAVDVLTIDQSQALREIERLNKDTSVHGIIVQIPLPDPAKTTAILNAVTPAKDVDGLHEHTHFDPATPMAINWLLAGYNINLQGQKIVIVGHGRLVGKPLSQLWQASGYDVTVADKRTAKLKELTRQADILVTATGVPGLITDTMVKPEVVIIDAGVATDNNGLVGDVASNVRDLPNITITPEKGGVGPLTVAALFENVIKAAEQHMANKK